MDRTGRTGTSRGIVDRRKSTAIQGPSRQSSDAILDEFLACLDQLGGYHAADKVTNLARHVNNPGSAGEPSEQPARVSVPARVHDLVG